MADVHRSVAECRVWTLGYDGYALKLTASRLAGTCVVEGRDRAGQFGMPVEILKAFSEALLEAETWLREDGC